jgi:hypothetical protein
METGTIYKFSLKVGHKLKHWQYKIAATHEVTILMGMVFLLNKVCILLGYDYKDRDMIYDFSMSDAPFEGYQIMLHRMDDVPLEVDQRLGRLYSVELSTIGDFQAEPCVPEFFNNKYFKHWPDHIFFKFEKTTGSGIIN